MLSRFKPRGVLEDDEDADEDADRNESEPGPEPDQEADDDEEEAAGGEDEAAVQQTLFSPEDEPSSPIELYRRDEMIEAQKDWHMALLIFQEMGWQPARPLQAYVHPLTFITHDVG